jgi:preprotein translocase subunit SecG
MLHFLFGLLHLAVSVALVFFILIQSNKGMGLSGAFGAAGGSDSVFGASGGINILMKITIGLSLVFVVTCCVLSYIPPKMSTGSIFEGAVQTESVSELINQSRSGADKDALPASQTAPQP